MPNGTRRAHARNGKPVRAATIKHPKPPKKRLTAGARQRAQHKPLLYAAGTLAGLGALDAILTGRWFTAGVLFFGAGAFLVTHVAWQAHKNRQAAKPGKPKTAAVRQRREALEKARGAHRPATQADAPPVEQEVAAANARDHARIEAREKQRRYDEMQSMLKRQRGRGQTEMVWPSQYEEFFDGPGKIKPRPAAEKAAPPKAAPNEWSTPRAAAEGEPTTHAESVARYGHRCDCRECRAKRRAARTEKAVLR